MAIENINLIKQQLEEKGISHQQIADSLQVSKAVVTKILNESYNGAEDTIKKVVECCKALLNDEPLDLSIDILQNSEAFQKLLVLGTNSSKFDMNTKRVFMNMHDSLSAYNQNKEKQKVSLSIQAN